MYKAYNLLQRNIHLTPRTLHITGCSIMKVPNEEKRDWQTESKCGDTLRFYHQLLSKNVFNYIHDIRLYLDGVR